MHGPCGAGQTPLTIAGDGLGYVEPSLLVMNVGGDPGACSGYLRSSGTVPDDELMSRVLNIEVVVIGKI